LKEIPVYETDAGLYLLGLKFDDSLSIHIGSLGKVHLKKGGYLYCGSARKNLSSRISRHVLKRKKARWHIDYLTSQENAVVELVRIFSLKDRTECGLNLQVQELPGAEPLPRFGCSDCSCSSHLTFFRRLPIRAIRRL
jgi:sugar fermentation stimulation protein A